MNNVKTFKTEQICRSLLQKSVRRGATSVTEKAAIHLIQKGDTAWLKNRLGVITFEESWTRVSELQFTTDESSLIKQYIDLSNISKNKDAAGLGSLAYELSKGVTSTISMRDPENKHIKIVAEAIKRPDDFWRWTKKIRLDTVGKNFLEKAELGHRLAGWPWDKAFALASAYLFVSHDIPEVTLQSPKEIIDFPFWVAIDKHTSTGKQALLKCSEKFNLNKTVIGWIQFYLESAKCENLETSPWWEREKSWRLESEGVGGDKSTIIWNNISDFIKEIVAAEASNIKEELEHSLITYKTIIKNQEKLL